MIEHSPRALQPYSRSAVTGAAIACLVVLGAVILCGNGVSAFVSVGGLVIVLGGVIAVAFMSFRAADVREALGAIMSVLRLPASERCLGDDMEKIVGWAHLVREGGPRQLESSLRREAHDPLVRYGLNMVLSEYAAEDVRSMMETAADGALERDSLPVEVLQAMTSHAPAFGMVGTLIGMVAMLCDLGGDVSSIGPTLAVSFLSTLYGVVSARMVYMPAASRLEHEIDRRHFRNRLITQGMVMLAERRPPSYVRDRLNGFLAPEASDYLDTITKVPESPRPSRQIGRRADRAGVPPRVLSGLKAISL